MTRINDVIDICTASGSLAEIVLNLSYFAGERVTAMMKVIMDRTSGKMVNLSAEDKFLYIAGHVNGFRMDEEDDLYKSVSFCAVRWLYELRRCINSGQDELESKIFSLHRNMLVYFPAPAATPSEVLLNIYKPSLEYFDCFADSFINETRQS